MKLWETYKNYGMGKEALSTLGDDIVIQNYIMLKRVSFVCSMLLLLFTISPLFIEKRPDKTIAFLSFAGSMSVIYLVIDRLQRANLVKEALATLMTIVVFFAMVFAGLYISVFTNSDKPAVSYMIILICVQTFIITPLGLKLALNGVALVLFCVFVYLIKSPSIVVYEVQNILVTTIAAIVLGWNYTHIRCKEMYLSNLLTEKSMTDELTSIGNRRFFFDALDKHMTSGKRLNLSGCIAVLDVDFFKEYNDHYGHPAGDVVLKRLGEVLLAFSKQYGLITCRIGGEEFALLWNERRSNIICSAMLELRQAIAALKMEHSKSKVSPYVTVSIGIYFMSNAADETAEMVYKCADMALYEAKQSGRDRIIRCHGEGNGFSAITPQESDMYSKKRSEAKPS